MDEKKKQIVDLTRRLLQKKCGAIVGEQTGVALLAGDGSPRIFFRICFSDHPPVVAVMPAGNDPGQMAEARSAWLIGGHLHRAGVPVPRPVAYDVESGTIVFEDLGDLRLHDVALDSAPGKEATLYRWYQEAVRHLVRMQVEGGRGFDVSWCWQSETYDRELMLIRESGYFLQALCQGLLGLNPDISSLQREFEDIADHAAAAPATYFLHRDFQSRNLMLHDGRLRIIDFQGGRLGPLAYDLASLLLDPYVGLNRDVQDALLTEYLQELNRFIVYDPGRFHREYFYLALQRNLQILGAFAFLGGNRGKSFFLPFIRPALLTLHERLANEGQGGYPVLTQLVTTCQEQLQHHGI